MEVMRALIDAWERSRRHQAHAAGDIGSRRGAPNVTWCAVGHMSRGGQLLIDVGVD
jgi:hypothetical protein